jgi:galactitol-specific phosphotransferase system IIC component
MEKQKVLQIRLTDLEKQAFTESANLAGIPLSSWVRERLRLAAIRDLESAGQKIPFVTPIHIESENT